jgi:DNA-binding HxlR family transcriptional regulator
MPPVVRLTGALDPRSSWSAEHCTLARSLEVVGTRTTMLILREAFYGTARFDEFAERVGMSESVAAARLKELVDEGMLEREPYREPGQRTRHQYRLTQKGAELLPALIALQRWGDRWLDEQGGRVELRHHDCGERVEVELRCAAGHKVDTDELEMNEAGGRRRRQARAS